MTTTQIEPGVGTRKLPDPESRRWQPLRAGIQNIWEYDDQRFVFHHGRLLLRGRNEAGKSKALEVLLPFLLDGNLSPQRLDPFGSTSRKMRWNLINDNRADVNVSIGYLWIEFGRVTDTGFEYCTIGAGLRARRSNTNIEAWYFITNQRVDDDLDTFGAGRVPLHKGQLSEAIGGSGIVYDKGSDYRREVNGRLFGMSQDQYDTLIEALLQLRRPQLSKQLQPAELSRMLSLSLPPLDGAVVGRLAEGFDRLDRHREERERRFDALSTVRKFLDVYGAYAKALARARAQSVTEAAGAYRRACTKLREAETAQQAAAARVESLLVEIRELERSDLALATRIDTLKSSDAYRAAQELDVAEKDERETAKRLKRAEDRAREAQRARDAQRGQLDEARRDRSAAGKEQRDLARAATESARGADLLDSQSAIDAQLAAREPTSARGTLRSALAHREQSVRSVAAEKREAERLRVAWEKSELRRRETEEEVRLRREQHADAERAASAAREAFVGSVRTWADSSSILTLLASQLEHLIAVPPELAAEEARRLVKPHRVRIDDAIARLQIRRTEIQSGLDQLRQDHDRLVKSPHLAPDAPFWREERGSRPGAPLFLLCEFADAVGSREAACMEAALEASGLLDAWLTPDGTILDPDTFDVFLRPSPLQGRTLADILRPTPAGDVSGEVIERALRSIALCGNADEPDEPESSRDSCRVGTDGSWKLGPLQGSWRKERVVFIGETARREARARRIAELEAAIGERENELHEAESGLTTEQARRDDLDAEDARFPTAQPVRDRAAGEDRALAELRRAHDRHGEASAAARKAEKRWQEAEAKRDSVAAQCGLARWVGELDTLNQRTVDYRLAVLELFHAADRHASLADRVQEKEAALGETESRVRVSGLDVEEERRRETQARSRVEALREAAGKTRTDVLARLREFEEQRGALALRLSAARDEKGAADTNLGTTEAIVESSAATTGARDEDRKRAEAGLQRFATSGLLPIAGIELDERSDDWNSRRTLVAARKVQVETGTIDYDDSAREKAENRVAERHQDLRRGLPEEFRVLSKRSEGALLYEVIVGTQTCGLRDVARSLEGDIVARDRLLGEEERKLFETFLSGEAHVHLGDRLRQARALVDRMNEQLMARPTASGMLLRLQWKVNEDAPTGAEGAINLVLKSSHLLADSERSALQQFLEQRLVEAREDDAPGSLREKMLGVLDYRTWFQFRIEIRDEHGRWKRMTRKTHAAGSGGQKAVMLHLPLFAAAAAFYEAASEGSVRLIMLDEAFAGIDREMRGQLMGLLAEFDLDFLMTSHDEWGFYRELDGLATYHLQREPGIPGVYTDRFLWDGQQAHELRVS